jgi:predicted amidophosphoribosyltransferase
MSAWRAWARELGQGLLQLLYPAFCHACGQSLAAEQADFCDGCRSKLTTDPHPNCPRCGGTVGPFVFLEGGCPACRQQAFHFEGVRRLGPYDGLLKEMILRLKQLSGDGLAEALGELWAKHAAPALRALGVEMVIPVPLHWRRRLSRWPRTLVSRAGPAGCGEFATLRIKQDNLPRHGGRTHVVPLPPRHAGN